MLACLALFGGCEGRVASEADSAFEGADIDAQMKAQEEVGQNPEKAAPKKKAAPEKKDEPEKKAAPEKKDEPAAAEKK